MDLQTEQIAELVHEANRAYCRLLGDHSQAPWSLAPGWQRDSMRQGVEAILDGSAPTPEAQHMLWMARKIKEGWTYAEEKNAEAKQHPCMLPYAQLPPEQRFKDTLARAIVLACQSAGADDPRDQVQPSSMEG